MTVIAAIKKEGEVWIGVDSFWGDHYHQMMSSAKDTSKIISFKNFKIAIAGYATLRDACQLLAEEEFKEYLMDTKEDARTFAAKLYEKLFSLVSKGCIENPKEDAYRGSFIIASKSKIFQVFQNLSCFEMEYCSGGAGERFCLAAMDSLVQNDLINSPEEILYSALKTTCRLSPYCSEPIVVEKV